tara:strand:- start:117 stop:875 length:759 start_codon:yes stop_codon:yes gene_type:complete
MYNKDHLKLFDMVFFPRKTYVDIDEKDLIISVNNEVDIGSRVYLNNKSNHNIIFFHGNGEICHEYDMVGSTFNQLNLNFIVVDYRGYGISTGSPSKDNLLSDSIFVFDWLSEYFHDQGYSGQITIMGRSLGSASVCNIINLRSDKIHSCIIESGFSTEDFFCDLLSIDKSYYEEKYGFGNLRKISKYQKPLYIIHADQDHIVPFDNGLKLYEACPSNIKKLFIVEGANHNNILSVAQNKYFKNIKRFIDNVN